MDGGWLCGRGHIEGVAICVQTGDWAGAGKVSLRGFRAPGEEAAPGTPTGFAHGLVVAWLQEACDPHKTVCKNLKVHRDIFSTSTNLCQF